MYKNHKHFNYRSPYIVFVILLFTTTYSFSQDTISTDRPDQTDGTSTVTPFKVQLEDGATFGALQMMNNFMLRLGISNSTEFRLAIDAGKYRHQRGLLPIAFGIKQRINKQHKVLPAIALIGNVSFGQLASKYFRNETTYWDLKLAFENQLSKRFSIAYNVGVSDNFNQLDLTFEVGYQASKRIGTFLEYFASVYHYGSEHNIDLGMYCLIFHNFQADIAIGHAVQFNQERYFLTFGLGYLIP